MLSAWRGVRCDKCTPETLNYKYGRAHEELADFSQKVPSIAPAARDPTTALPPLTVGTGPMDLATHAQA